MARSCLSSILIGLLAGGATTAVCFGDALKLGPARQVAELVAGPSSSAATGSLDALTTSSSWLTPVPGGTSRLRGKVVVVNFWTYSCINSLRALPHLRAWERRYRDKGLVVVGVHAPEFGFERDTAKVRTALSDLSVSYPNVQDNDHAIWRRFGNEGWPGFYFIDATGRTRAYRLGEGHYDEAEQLIRRLLTEAGQDVSGIGVGPTSGSGAEAEADWQDLRSPEGYLGYAKARNFRSPGGLERDGVRTYAAASDLALDQWDLAGAWLAGREYLTLKQGPGSIRYRFHSRDLHLVLGGTGVGKPVRFRVLVDGRAPGASHGADVDENGWGEVRRDRLYQLVRQTSEVTDRTVSVAFARPGVRAYVVTFG